MKYQHSTIQVQSSCHKDETLRMAQAGREREREKWLTGVSGLKLKFNSKFQILNLI
jgi:hypothetical protein